jgi:hypothetical protein
MNNKIFKKYSPKSIDELKEIINKLLMERGSRADLNDIDTSKIDDMSDLFSEGYFRYFNGDISKWDVSNVKDMSRMFERSDFNGDISKWDVSKVKNMRKMFYDSKFTGEQSDISKWDVSNVKDMINMFGATEFNRDISNWELNKDCDTSSMFWLCHIKEEYKPKIK